MKKIFTAFLIFSGIIQGNAQAPSSFSYMGAFDASGKPQYLLPQGDQINGDLMQLIQSALPEKSPVPVHHPEYISGKTTSLQLKSSGDVWVTFVHSDAGYNNSLGYFTYPPGNPPVDASQIQKHAIIFPNVQYPSKGGGLNQGDKVYLGNFPANTAIGWFVVSDGFKNGTVTGGKYILYSLPHLNPELQPDLKPHNVFLNDPSRNLVILGFEDMRRDQNSDNDFNDVLFYVTVNPHSAIKTEDLASVTPTGPQPPSCPPTGINNNNDPYYQPPAYCGNTVIISKPAATGCAPGPGNYGYPPNYPTYPQSGPNCSGYLSDCDYQQMLWVVRNQCNDYQKLAYLRSLCGGNFISSQQAAGFILLFRKDVNRFEAAKYIQGYIWDRHNLHMIVNTFSHPYYRNQFSVYVGIGSCGTGAPQYDHPGNWGPPGQYYNAGYCSPQDFQLLKQAIGNQPFSSDKMIVLKQGTSGRMFSSAQVSELVELFTFESDKLEAAKHMYAFTYDPQNFYLVNSSFTFSSSVREMNRFISMR